MIGTNWQGIKNELLVENIFIYNQKREPNQNLIIIPVNLENNHWVIVFLDYTIVNSNIVNPEIYYIDPLGRKPHKKVNEVLNLVFPNGMKKTAIIPQPGLTIQTDGDNCRPWIIEIARCFIPNKDLSGIEKVIIEDARAEHVKMLEERDKLITMLY